MAHGLQKSQGVFLDLLPQLSELLRQICDEDILRQALDTGLERVALEEMVEQRTQSCTSLRTLTNNLGLITTVCYEQLHYRS